MAEQDIRVHIEANIKDLEKKLKRATQRLKEFDKVTDSAHKPVNKLNTSVKGAVPALTSFSQVVQDAPYGIRGVANNIQQLTMQMGHLSANAGGAKNALKAMVGSLMGPAGILLAVSLVTSLLVSYGDELKNIGSASAKVAKEHEKLVESLGQTSDVLSAQISALEAQIELLEAQKLPTKELKEEKLKLLKTDLATTVAQRTNLKLQLDALKVADMQLTIWEKTLNAISLSQGRGAFEVGGLSDKELAKYKELEISLAGIDKTIATLALSIGKIESPEIFDPKSKKNFSSGVKEQLKLVEKEIASSQKIWAENNKALQDHLQEKEDIETSAEDARLAKIFKHQQERISAIYGGNELELKLYNDYVESAKSQYLEFSEWKKTQQGLEASLRIKKEKETSDAILRIQESNAKRMEGLIESSFTGLGAALGDALTGTLDIADALGGSILSTVGSMLVELGKMTIAAAITMKALKLAFANPVTAIAAGVALVALGSAFSKGAQGILSGGGSGGESGGGISSSTGASTRSFSGSNFGSSSTRSVTGGHYVFEIQGTKLVGVLRNTLSRNNSLGGGISLTG